MYILINYKGQIRNSPLGMVYNFPHYSTILGSILAVYHKQNKTPLFPRIDMLKLASEIGLKLIYGYESGKSKTVKEMILGTDYSTSNTNNKTLLKVNKTISSPLSLNIFEGNYYIVLESNNETLIKGLQRFSLSIGTRTEIPSDYSLMGVYQDFEGIKDQIRPFDIRWVCIKEIQNEYVGLYLDEFDHLGDLEDQNINPILMASPYTMDYPYLCTVSQIKWEEINSKNSLQGLYSRFDIDTKLSADKLLDYNRLLNVSKKNIETQLKKD